MYKGKYRRYCITVPLFLIITGLLGCSGSRKIPQYQANWSKLRTGMSKEEVVCLLGESMSKSEPIKPEPNPDSSPLNDAIGTIFARTIFDSWFERWHYGEFEMFDNLLSPSDKAYVVYFGGSQRVVSFRRPISEDSEGK